MELTQLRYFYAVARHGSMSAAARALEVTQPTITMAIQRLEAHFDTTLFLRDRQGVRLTATGRALLDHVRAVLDTLQSARDQIQGLETDQEGLFTLGCHPGLGAYFLPGFLPDFMRQFPGIEVHLHNTSSEAVRQAVISREVHFGLVVNPLPHPDLVIVDLFPDSVGFFVLADSMSAPDTPEGPTVLSPTVPSPEALDRLAQGPIVIAGPVVQSRQLMDALVERAIPLPRIITCGDLELVKSLTLGGVGVGVLPQRVARYHQPERLTWLSPALPTIPDRICLLYRGDLHRTRAAMTLKDALAAHGRAMAKEDR